MKLRLLQMMLLTGMMAADWVVIVQQHLIAYRMVVVKVALAVTMRGKAFELFRNFVSELCLVFATTAIKR